MKRVPLTPPPPPVPDRYAAISTPSLHAASLLSLSRDIAHHRILKKKNTQKIAYGDDLEQKTPPRIFKPAAKNERNDFF